MISSMLTYNGLEAGWRICKYYGFLIPMGFYNVKCNKNFLKFCSKSRKKQSEVSD